MVADLLVVDKGGIRGEGFMIRLPAKFCRSQTCAQAVFQGTDNIAADIAGISPGICQYLVVFIQALHDNRVSLAEKPNCAGWRPAVVLSDSQTGAYVFGGFFNGSHGQASRIHFSGDRINMLS